MASPKWRPNRGGSRRASLRLGRGNLVRRACAAIAFGIFIVVSYLTYIRGITSPTAGIATMHERESFRIAPVPRLFIAIGSAPSNYVLRHALRNSWLKWLPVDGSVKYRFFTDLTPNSDQIKDDNRHVWSQLAHEIKDFSDIVQQPISSGYGDKEHNSYGVRARYQMKWALDAFPELSYFLRVDDDSFLCLHKLVYELKSAPKQQFFWGRYWCRAGRNRADESFMLFSRDVVKFVADDSLVGKIIPFDNSVTFGWNFGFLAWFLNLTVFDDQTRIDSQQGYLTTYMHNANATDDRKVRPFCDTFMYAHHVKASKVLSTFASAVTHLLYDLPKLTPPSETCSLHHQSFLPARHSKHLPDIKIERAPT